MRLFLFISSLLFSLNLYAAYSKAPKVEGELDIDPDNISGMVLTPQFMALATDEGTAIQILPRKQGQYIAHSKGVITLSDGQEELDLEGLAWQKPYLYAIGSHSKKRKKAKTNLSNKKNLKRLTPIYDEPARNQLFRIKLNRKLEAESIQSLSLMPWIKKNELLAPFRQIPSKENGIDMEGIAIVGKHLYIGFRGPVLRGNLTPILKLTLKKGKDFAIKKYKLKLVNLDGLGIRDMTSLDDQLYLLTGPVNSEPNRYTIRTWDGKTHIEPFKVLKAFHKPKGKPENLVVKRSQKSPGLVIFIAQDGLKNGEIRRYFLPD